MNRLLPAVRTMAEYRPLFREEASWLPALRCICARHHLDPSSLRLAPPGSNIVFWVEDGLLIKLFAPLWPGDAQKEAAVLKALSGHSSFQIPRIAAGGELEGWPYLVLSRLDGQPLDEIWGELDPQGQEQIADSLGNLVTSLRSVPTSALKDILEAWPGSFQGQAIACLDRQRELGVSSFWLDQIAAFFEATLPNLASPFPGVFLHADLNPEHLFCQQSPEGWKVTGVIDFADAMLGHPYYEFVAPGIITHSSPRLRRVMLQAAGIQPDYLNDRLSQTLLAFTLLHRFSNLPDLFGMLGPNPPADLRALQTDLWGL